jgi:hypothetical protein
LTGIIDQRPFHDSIAVGTKAGDTGMVAIRTTSAVDKWLYAALQQSAACYGLAIRASADSLVHLRLAVTVAGLDGVYNKDEYRANVALSARLSDSASILWSGAVAGEKTMPASFPRTGYDLGICLNRALVRALHTLDMHLAAVIDSLHATEPVVTPPPYGGRYRPELIDSICDLDKSLYVIAGSRTAREVYDYMRRQEYLFKADQKAVLDKCPLIEGKMFVVVEISGKGTIGYAEVARSNIECPQLAKKVLSRLRAMRFKTGKSGAATSVVYKIGFDKMAQLSVTEKNKAAKTAGAGLIALLIFSLFYWLLLRPALFDSNG